MMRKHQLASFVAFAVGVALFAPVLVGASSPGCTLGKASEGEGEGVAGEGEGAAAGEGEGEGEGATHIDVGAPPEGYSETPPAGSTGACSTGQWWTLGDRGRETMHPGQDCIACHAQGEGPQADTAGTVMGAFHDEDDCRGVPGVSVDFLDSTGASLGTLPTDDAGNIIANGLSGQYRVRLTYQGRTREMLTLQTDGDCMHCHTAQGANGAPGRIIAP